eukprot:1191555-Prorocentrum_minimum.AAC.3
MPFGDIDGDASRSNAELTHTSPLTVGLVPCAGSPFSWQGLHHCGFICENLERSLEFYCGKLGNPADTRLGFTWLPTRMKNTSKLCTKNCIQGSRRYMREVPANLSAKTRAVPSIMSTGGYIRESAS